MSTTRYSGPITEPRTFEHRIADSGLVTDTALADLLDINLYDYDGKGQVSLREVERGQKPTDGLRAQI